jgi:hypothetical protein
LPPAQAAQLRTAAGILLAEIRDLDRRSSELSAEDRAALRKKRAELNRIQGIQLQIIPA